MLTFKNMNCKHEKWTAKKVPLSDGRPSLREFCVSCGRSYSGTNLGYAIPMIADTEIAVLSYKYPNKTLGEIQKIDEEYLVWLIKESKASDRIKKSAARVYYNNPYIPPKEGEVYTEERCYNPATAWHFIKKIIA